MKSSPTTEDVTPGSLERLVGHYVETARPSIEELEAMLAGGETNIEILPDGTFKSTPANAKLITLKPTTPTYY